MVSQGWQFDGREFASAVSGQASPMDVLSTLVREAGQIGARPSIRTDQSVGRGIIGIEEARVLGWDRR
jgi:hypothetical protein